jgi:hypothetical protein
MSDVPPTPWQRASSSRKGRRNEQEAAKISGGRAVSGSGSGRIKGDVRTGQWCISNKFTEAHSFRITEDDLDKMTADALRTPPGLLPQMRVEMPRYRLRILREDDYLMLEAQANGEVE